SGNHRPIIASGNRIQNPGLFSRKYYKIYNQRIKFQLVFKLQSLKDSAVPSYSGVLEFDAQEGNVYLQGWMFQNLGIEEGENIVVSNASNVLKGFYMKPQPHTKAFTELSDPRAILEKVLRGFTCLGSRTTIAIKYNRVNPGDVIALIDTDCEVEFAPLKGGLKCIYHVSGKNNGDLLFVVYVKDVYSY
ncbi:hypothetical protein MIMGU_mgv1a026499mg, partial [Erythranthe guttata]